MQVILDGWYTLEGSTEVYWRLGFGPEEIRFSYAGETFKSFLIRDVPDWRGESGSPLMGGPGDFSVPLSNVNWVRFRRRRPFLLPSMVINTPERRITLYTRERGARLKKQMEDLRELLEGLVDFLVA